MPARVAAFGQPTTKDILKLTWPMTLKAMMLHGIIIIDAWLVSALGEPALAAMGLAGALGGFLLGTQLAFSNATQIRTAQAQGIGEPVALKTSFFAGLIINLITAVLGLTLVIAIGGWVLDSFAHTPWIAEQAKRYLMVFILVVLTEAVGQCIGSYFNGTGRTIVPMFSYLIAIPLNIAVSYVLIHGTHGFPQLGVMGAAVGSVVASLVRTCFMAVLFLRLTGAFRGTAGWKNDTLPQSVRRHFAFAWPIAATFLSMILANNVSMLLYAKMSVNAFAAMTLIMPWVQVAGTFGITWAQATGIFIAQLLGRESSSQDLDDFLRRGWRGAFVAAGLVSLTYLAVILASPRLYSGLEPETVAALFSFLPILLLLPFPKGSNAICGNTLRASGDTFYVMNIFVAAQWCFRLPLAALFILYLDAPVTWVFALLLAEELFKFPLFHLRVWRGKWKEGQVLA